MKTPSLSLFSPPPLPWSPCFPVFLKRTLHYIHSKNSLLFPFTSLLFPFHAFYILHDPNHGCFRASPAQCREPFGLLLLSYGIRCDSNEHSRKAVTTGNIQRLDFRSNDWEPFQVLIILLCCSLSKLKLNLNLLNPAISM